MIVKDILQNQREEISRKLGEKYIEREVRLDMGNPLIKVVLGPRRAGKSFFALKSIKDSFGYVNFDDERLVEAKDYDEIIAAANSVYGNPKALLLDEIQNLPRWELFVNRLARQGYNIVITGSNSKMLSQELATHLTGRHLKTTVLTFSFKEYLKTFQKELTAAEKKAKLMDYMVLGGYPEPAMKGLDYKDYISTLFDSIIYADIIRRHNLRNGKQLEALSYYLLSNIAAEYSYNSLTKMVGISQNSIQKYINFLEEAFLFFSVGKFSFKVKEQVSANKKIYCYDNGFIFAKGFNTSPNYGKLMENIVAIKLSKEGDIFYWKAQEEVDFVVSKNNKVQELIQVCYALSPETKQRELRGLIKASSALNCSNLVVITLDEQGEEEFEWYGTKRKVKYIPLMRWLES